MSVVDGFCQAEVHDRRTPIIGDHDVRRLDIAVDDPLFMRRLEPPSDLHGDVDCIDGFEPCVGEPFAQCLALEVGHRDKRSPFGFIDIVYRADVGVVQRSGGLCFVDKARPFFIGLEKMRREELELCVLGLVHHTHAALADLFQDPVVENRLVSGELAHGLVMPGLGRRYR
jgi:hypothetical protein